MCGLTTWLKTRARLSAPDVCVKQGTKYGLVVGKKVYTLEGHEAELEKGNRMKATVKGNVAGETVTVQSAVPAMKMK
jgi:hypothetical protein